MSATFTTKITGLKTVSVQGTLTDVVTEVSWMVIAKDGDKIAVKKGSTAVNPPDASNFIAFPNLTLAEVSNWIPDPSTTDVQNALTAQLALQASPTVSLKMPPWAMQRRFSKPSSTG